MMRPPLSFPKKLSHNEKMIGQQLVVIKWFCIWAVKDWEWGWTSHNFSSWPDAERWAAVCFSHWFIKQEDGGTKHVQTISRIPFVCGRRCMRSASLSSMLYLRHFQAFAFLSVCLRVVIPVCEGLQQWDPVEEIHWGPHTGRVSGRGEGRDRKLRCLLNSLIEGIGMWHVTYRSLPWASHLNAPPAPTCIRLARSQPGAHVGPQWSCCWTTTRCLSHGDTWLECSDQWYVNWFVSG